MEKCLPKNGKFSSTLDRCPGTASEIVRQSTMNYSAFCGSSLDHGRARVSDLLTTLCTLLNFNCQMISSG
jgi:hypothetical protein